MAGRKNAYRWRGGREEMEPTRYLRRRFPARLSEPAIYVLHYSASTADPK